MAYNTPMENRLGFPPEKTKMEKKLLVIVATLLAKLFWRFGKISSGPLRLLVFWIVQAIVLTSFTKIRKSVIRKRQFRAG